jgi:AcrR family transcriptional regulator
MVAREAGVTRPLLNHYFKNANDVKQTALKYVRLLFQKLAVDSLSRAVDPEERLAAYVEACFYWAQNFRRHSLVWMSFLIQCAHSEPLRQLNSSASAVGEERIFNLILEGQKAGRFSDGNATENARLIQILICGALVVFGSEDIAEPREYIRSIQRACLKLAGFEANS